MRGAFATLVVLLAVTALSLDDVTAEQQSVDPRTFALQLADLPRGFSVVEHETSVEKLRVGQTGSESDVVGVSFKTAMERPRTLEHLQSGPVRVSQIIARSDDPARATFSLEAQREFNVREHGYAVAESSAPAGELLCLVRREGPFVEYRIVTVRNADTLISTTAIGLPSAVDLDGAIALTQVTLARYDTQLTSVVAAVPGPRDADARSLNPDLQAVATATPTPPLTLTPVAQTVTPGTTLSAQPPAQAPRVRLPARFDERMGQPWSELMSSTATTKSGELMPAFFRRVVEETRLKVGVGALGPDVGGELRSVAERDGDRLKVVETGVTINKDVMTESPRVLAAMLAHEITHASQPIVRSSGQLADCVEAEVEAYAVQARVWGAFWGQAHRPGQTKWERSMNYVEEVWNDSGEDGLRHLIRSETSTDAHSCIG